MRIAIVGYGKMGHAIESIAKSRGHEISVVIDENNQEQIGSITPQNTDIAIEFSQPDSAFQNIHTLVTNKVKTIAGTTGWLDRYPEIVKLCEATQGTFLYASNFSIGVNLFFELNEWVAQKMSGLGQFTPAMEEVHHTEKKDTPSGTAITLAEGIMTHIPSITNWVNKKTTSDDLIGIVSLREPNVPGTHTVSYSSTLETIEIKHVAHDRKVFAQGVIIVAEWVTNQTGVLSIKDFLKNQL